MTKYGRREICRMVGINDENSIFVRNEDAFNDRMKLYRVLYNTDRLIEVYNKELNKFDTEKNYITFLNDGRKAIIDDVTKRLKACMAILKIRKTEEVFNNHADKMKFNTLVDNEYLIRLWFDCPKYEGLKYICYGLCDLPSTLSKYIKGITGSNFLALMNDLYTDELEHSLKELLRKSEICLSASIFDELSPSYINKKELRFIGNSEVIYFTSPNRTVQSLETIYDALLSNEYLQLENINIQMFKYERLAKNNNIKKRCVVSSTIETDPYNVDAYDTLSLVAYLRKMYEEPLSKYDRYFEYNNIEARISRDLDIDWV